MRRRASNGILGAWFAAASIAISLQGSPSAFACSCMAQPPMSERVDMAKGVYVAVPPSPRPPGKGSPHYTRMLFEVLHTLKGPARATLPVHVVLGDESACGIDLEDREHLLFLEEETPGLSLCDSYPPAAIAEAQELLGPGILAAAPEDDDESSFPWPWFLALGLGAGVVGLVARHRMRAKVDAA